MVLYGGQVSGKLSVYSLGVVLNFTATTLVRGILMKENLSEEEVRQALFGVGSNDAIPEVQDSRITSDSQHVSKSRKVATCRSPKLRVKLRVTTELESKADTFIYDANTLSSLIAEQQAKTEAKKMKFKYFELISIESI